MRGCEAVLHLANLTKLDPALDRTVSSALCVLAQKERVPNFFYASSIRVYGNARGELTENAPARPLPSDSYGTAKLATETALRALSAPAGLTKLRVLRIGHVLTPENLGRLPPRLSPRFLWLWGRGFPHYISVADAVGAILFLLKKNLKDSQPEIFHVTRDEPGARYADLYGPASFSPLPLSATWWLSSFAAGARESRCARIIPENLYRLGWKFSSAAPSREQLQITS
jgi:nucleoside-diphosphate-sugar epimerase